MSKYKEGDKIVLEIISGETYGDYLAGSKEQNWWFNAEGLERGSEPLSTYTEPLEAKIRRQAAEITRLLRENKELKNEKQELTRERNQLMGRCGGLSAAKIKAFNNGRLAGQNEAWELARKIVLKNGYSCDDLHEIFNFYGSHQVLENYTYQEATAKVAEREKAKEEIKAGDIIKIHEGNDNDLCVLCMSTDKKYYNAVDRYGALYCMLTKEMFTKTGRHIDIDSFLKQIGEAE